MRIALLEDDKDQAALLEQWFEDVEHKVETYNLGQDLIRSLRNETYDLMIIDWLLPGMDGIEVLKLIREQGNNTPVLFVTRKNAEQDIVEALDSGADDFMEKPLRQKELLARVQALGRRLSLGHPDRRVLEYPPYKIDLASHYIQFKDEWLELTQKEYKLAVFLFLHAGQTLSREHILVNVWAASASLNTRTVDTHVSRLRKKLNFDQQDNWVLSSIYQEGYRLDHRPSPQSPDR